MTTFYRLKEDGKILDYIEFEIATETKTEVVTEIEYKEVTVQKEVIEYKEVIVQKEVIEYREVLNENDEYEFQEVPVMQDVVETIEVPVEKEVTVTIDHIPAFIRELYIETDRKIIKLTDGSFAFEDEANLAEEEKRRIAKEFEEAKQAKLNEAGAMFAQERDKVRFIQLDENRRYGFDCANEDVTNFMASYVPLLIMQGGTTEYKVYLNENNIKEKELVYLSFADMHKAYLEVSADQKEAYKWYGAIKARIDACTTKEEVESIVVEIVL